MSYYATFNLELMLSWSIHVNQQHPHQKNSIPSQIREFHIAMQLQQAGDGVSEAMYWLSMYILSYLLASS